MMPLENKASHGDFSTEMALCCLLEEVVPDRLASREYGVARHYVQKHEIRRGRYIVLAQRLRN